MQLLSSRHLGEGAEHEPSGSDFWSVVPGQLEYHGPLMIEMGVEKHDINPNKCMDWLNNRAKKKPFC